MPWIKVDAELPRHRKTLALAAELGQHRWYAAGLLHDIWAWAIEHAKDGVIDPERQSESLARTIGARRDQAARYLVALRKVGWIDPDNRLHEWDEWGGQIVRDKEKDANRNRLKREHRREGHVLSIEGCPLCPRDASGGRQPLRPVDTPQPVQRTGNGASTGPSSGRSGGRPDVDKTRVDTPYPQQVDADDWVERRASELVDATTGRWHDVVAQLRDRAVGEGAMRSFVTHFEQAQLEERGTGYAVTVPHELQLHADWISKRYRDQLVDALGTDELVIEVRDPASEASQ